MCYFRGGPGNCLIRFTQYPSLKSGVRAVNASVYSKTKNSEIGSTYINLLNRIKFLLKHSHRRQGQV